MRGPVFVPGDFAIYEEKDGENKGELHPLTHALAAQIANARIEPLLRQIDELEKFCTPGVAVDVVSIIECAQEVLAIRKSLV